MGSSQRMSQYVQPPDAGSALESVLLSLKSLTLSFDLSWLSFDILATAFAFLIGAPCSKTLRQNPRAALA
jgi:hypothetical protein